MADNNTVFHGALAIIKSNGQPVGIIRSIEYSNSFRRETVKGLGTIMPIEMPVTAWQGSVSCDAVVVKLSKSGVPDAVKYNFSETRSQAEIGLASFEDQLVLNTEGVQLDIFRKVSDGLDSNGNIKPDVKPFAIIPKCFINQESLTIQEGALVGKRQSFDCMRPIIQLD